jgi:hypothetical protein
LTTKCLQVKGNFDIPTIIYHFQTALVHYWSKGKSTVVELLALHPKVKGLSLVDASGTERGKMAKNGL